MKSHLSLRSGKIIVLAVVVQFAIFISLLTAGNDGSGGGGQCAAEKCKDTGGDDCAVVTANIAAGGGNRELGGGCGKSTRYATITHYHLFGLSWYKCKDPNVPVINGCGGATLGAKRPGEE